jgi:lipopolysaccharide export system protein LptA
MRFSFSSFIAVSVLTCAVMNAAHAEKADREKPTIIEAERTSSNGKTKVTTLTGDVSMTRGTIAVKADHAVVTTQPDDTQYAILYGNKERKVTFRQKRDGGDNLWVEGEADRIEYDEKLELVKFISRGRVRYLEGKKVTEEHEGEYFTYDSAADVFTGENTAEGKNVPGKGRSKITLQPKSNTKEAK